MGQPTFPAPTDIDQILSLLSLKAVTLSLVEPDGTMHGELVPWLGISQTEGRGCFEIFAGDQVVFTSDTLDEAKAFLYGCFLLAYEGATPEPTN